MCKVMGHIWYSRISLVAMTFWLIATTVGSAADGRVVYRIKNYVMQGSGGFILAGDHIQIEATQLVDSKLNTQVVVDMAYIINVKNSQKVKGRVTGIDIVILIKPNEWLRIATLKGATLDFYKLSKNEIDALRRKK